MVTHMKNDARRKRVFELMGCRIHELSKVHGHRLTFIYFKEYKELFSSNKFDIVHNNSPDNLLPLFFAVLKKVPCRILHAHSNYLLDINPTEKARLRLYRIGYSLHSSLANVLIGVSRDAALSTFGANKEHKTILLPNAIDEYRFSYNPNIRAEYRKKLKCEHSLVLGHVGRYENNFKNQKFILELFKVVIERNPNAKLLMIGDGVYRQDYERLSRDYGIGDSVHFIGAVDNVEDYMQAMDIFVFPSLKEGLGIAAIEAQATGLPCLVSDRVPREVEISDSVEFLSIDNGVRCWVDAIERNCNYIRESNESLVRSSGFSIFDQAVKLDQIYQGVTSKSNNG